jgi:transcriptional regulator
MQSMYQPPQFKSDDPALALELMREHAFASLVSVDSDGIPFVTHLPLHVEERSAGEFVLLGHCARPNPHWRILEQRPDALVTFMGPHAYQSPKIYGDSGNFVPSWNYAAVHCVVRARLVTEPEAKDALLKKLIADHEPSFAERWRGYPPEYVQQMLAGIVGFELDVLRWECKIKLNQHRPASHAALRAAYVQGNEDERELARWMDRLGLKGN